MLQRVGQSLRYKEGYHCKQQEQTLTLSCWIWCLSAWMNKCSFLRTWARSWMSWGARGGCRECFFFFIGEFTFVSPVPAGLWLVPSLVLLCANPRHIVHGCTSADQGLPLDICCENFLASSATRLSLGYLIGALHGKTITLTTDCSLRFFSNLNMRGFYNFPSVLYDFILSCKLTYLFGIELFYTTCMGVQLCLYSVTSNECRVIRLPEARGWVELASITWECKSKFYQVTSVTACLLL